MLRVPKLRDEIAALDAKIAIIVSRRGFCEQEVEELRLRLAREEGMRRRVAVSTAQFADIVDVHGAARRMPIEEAKLAMEARAKVSMGPRARFDALVYISRACFGVV